MKAHLIPRFRSYTCQLQVFNLVPTPYLADRFRCRKILRHLKLGHQIVFHEKLSQQVCCPELLEQ